MLYGIFLNKCDMKNCMRDLHWFSFIGPLEDTEICLLWISIHVKFFWVSAVALNFNLYFYNCLETDCSQCFFNLQSQGQGLTVWHMGNHVVSVRLSRLYPPVKCSVIINCFETFQADSHLISASNNENVNCFNFCLQETVPTEYYSQRICHHSWGFHSRWVRF